MNAQASSSDGPGSIGARGYALIPAVFTHEEIAAVASHLEDLPLRRSRAGVRHAMRFEPVASLARSGELLGIAREILGSGAFPFRATLFEKSQASNWLVVWHQDTALPLCERRELPGWGPWSVKDRVTYAHAPANALSRVLALRVHLDDSTTENGPLRVLPGTHTLGVLDDEAISQLAARRIPVECEVPRGGVLAMRPLLVHASSKSQSSASRRVLHIEYADSPQIADGLELAVT
jgi:ectoine hydroxylase-related dioxygenase (phytanoyl-CoA dioxygenase family)